MPSVNPETCSSAAAFGASVKKPTGMNSSIASAIVSANRSGNICLSSPSLRNFDITSNELRFCVVLPPTRAGAGCAAGRDRGSRAAESLRIISWSLSVLPKNPSSIFIFPISKATPAIRGSPKAAAIELTWIKDSIKSIVAVKARPILSATKRKVWARSFPSPLRSPNSPFMFPMTSFMVWKVSVSSSKKPTPNCSKVSPSLIRRPSKADPALTADPVTPERRVSAILSEMPSTFLISSVRDLRVPICPVKATAAVPARASRSFMVSTTACTPSVLSVSSAWVKPPAPATSSPILTRTIRRPVPASDPLRPAFERTPRAAAVSSSETPIAEATGPANLNASPMPSTEVFDLEAAAAKTSATRPDSLASSPNPRSTLAVMSAA